jgi:UDP-N-acetylglucosamine enolpyruvyl transferase
MAHTSPTWKIEGGHQLSGSLRVKGSKNSALAIICAALLNTGPVILSNIPRISDVFDMVSILRSTGTTVTWLDNNTLEIQRPPLLAVDNLDIEASRRTRAVVLLVAALAKDQEVAVLGIAPWGLTSTLWSSLVCTSTTNSVVYGCLDRKPASQIPP